MTTLCPVDRTSLLSALDLTVSHEWQRLPSSAGDVAKQMELQVQAKAAQDGAAAYAAALRALCHHCPDALDTALEQVRAQVELMEQKLEFSRIRQDFVTLCTAFQTDAGTAKDASVHADALLLGVSVLQRRCGALIEAQPAQQSSKLPGLVTRRDTLLLHSSIRDIAMSLLEARRKNHNFHSLVARSGRDGDGKLGSSSKCAGGVTGAAVVAAVTVAPSGACDVAGTPTVLFGSPASCAGVADARVMRGDAADEFSDDGAAGGAANVSVGTMDKAIDIGRTSLHGIAAPAPRIRRKGRLAAPLVPSRGRDRRGRDHPCDSASCDQGEPGSEARDGGA